MRNFIVILNLAVVLLIASFISDPERQRLAAVADEREATTAKASLVSFNSKSTTTAEPEPLSRADRRATIEARKNRIFIKEFIYEISEARIMDREQGKLATQRGTIKPLKDYGALMVKDQTNMLKDLKRIALNKEVEVASVLGKKKTDGLSELHQLHGQNFDSRFIKMMIIDHKRDIKKLQKATRSKDADIQVFATKYLPVVKSHLAKLQSISAGK